MMYRLMMMAARRHIPIVCVDERSEVQERVLEARSHAAFNPIIVNRQRVDTIIILLAAFSRALECHARTSILTRGPPAERTTLAIYTQ